MDSQVFLLRQTFKSECLQKHGIQVQCAQCTISKTGPTVLVQNHGSNQ